MESIIRCPWCESSQLYREYHDQEWGRPVRDEQRMFEFLLLETFQAGLSWITILNKREHLRSTFHNFDIQRVADMGENEIERALKNPSIIRHEGKIRAAINNAQRTLEMKSQGLSLVEFFWSYIDGKPIINTPINLSDVPAVTPLAQQIAKDLKKRGFKFVGATTIYAHMQATGMVNDHLVGCHVKSDTMRKV